MASEAYRNDRQLGAKARLDGRPLSEMRGRAQREGWNNQDWFIERDAENERIYNAAQSAKASS